MKPALLAEIGDLPVAAIVLLAVLAVIGGVVVIATTPLWALFILWCRHAPAARVWIASVLAVAFLALPACGPRRVETKLDRGERTVSALRHVHAAALDLAERVGEDELVEACAAADDVDACLALEREAWDRIAADATVVGDTLDELEVALAAWARAAQARAEEADRPPLDLCALITRAIDLAHSLSASLAARGRSLDLTGGLRWDC